MILKITNTLVLNEIQQNAGSNKMQGFTVRN